ncbi:GDP-mannose 4,6-dehydratase [Bradyrhizobium sp. SZCCHNPS1003]|uniref:GDP-mannose 4,6-dehydratase n=1 Tax=Bradyrhizobium sp. SZCCHNPS1003 TaxID=3057330 RepID=UPI0039658698
MPIPGKRVLVTGAGGFVGRLLLHTLKSQEGTVVRGTTRGRANPDSSEALDLLDVTDESAVARCIATFRPSHIVNLAGVSSLAVSEADVNSTWSVHLHGTLNIARAVLREVPECTLLVIGSGEMYGSTALSGRPLGETSILAPISEYAASKAAADLAVGAMTRKGLRAVRLRPFNHTGPGQSDHFVVPSFASQIVAIEAGVSDPVIRVGNLDAERDFVDVRDVVGAYVAAIERSHHLPSDSIFNVASGSATRIGDLLSGLLALSSARIRVEQDPDRVRPIEIRRYVGSAERAREVLSWKPRYALSETLKDVYEFYRRRHGLQ